MERQMVGIYKITNLLNGKVYIGQSIDIQKRLKAHFAYAKNKNSKEYNTSIHNAIRKYGEENFICEILVECKEEDLDDLEQYYINYFNSANRDKGYNLTTGGLGGHKTNCRKILQYDLNGNFIKRWDAAWIAAKALNISVDNIRACCYGQKSANGFQWKFEDDDKIIQPYKRNFYSKGLELGRKPVQIIGINVKDNSTIDFDMIKDAAQWLIENNFSKATVESVSSRISTVKNTGKKAYGFIWKTKESD
jgi:hypothetical protein